ncbi:class I SAM-dependent methyltransferase [Microbulbifer halophilus]|uniref:Class I SAM-dependent methyltransferase n=1 Tax=Microbulbifer halophilus TaxID=453963 RepID=A0ABW5EEU5_9GAMM|nr:methyltransferase [Microbulbifer halophilus]MCW8126320.1 methyltransferase [Microbulbifer halophilus]
MKIKQLLIAMACTTMLAACSPQSGDAGKEDAAKEAAPKDAASETAAPAPETEAAAPEAAAEAPDLGSVIAGPQRTEEYAARDQYRHPQQTLEFFGIEPGMTVVEIAPGGGWYTEILAPYLREEGTFYAAHFPEGTDSDYYQRSLAGFKKKVAADKASYGALQRTEFDPASGATVAPAGSADAVLTFRNVHNWMRGENEQKAFNQFFAALKPGGVLGVVEHRAKPGTSREDMIESGYVTQEHVIEVAEKAGFELEDTSEINANPKDTADHPKGVWTLPPTLRLGDQDREKYLAIGESDRMTLRFRKPAAE